MPRGQFKSRTFRRLYRKTPTGQLKLVYKPRKKTRLQCRQCKIDLLGMPNIIGNRLTKSQRKPNRPYGGIYCSSCSRNIIMDMVRK